MELSFFFFFFNLSWSQRDLRGFTIRIYPPDGEKEEKEQAEMEKEMEKMANCVLE